MTLRESSGWWKKPTLSTMSVREDGHRKKHLLPPQGFRFSKGAALFLLVGIFLWAGGCDSDNSSVNLSQKAKFQWEEGQYADAARNFVTLAEIYPHDSLAEESLFWAANLYHHFLKTPSEAIRYYQQLLVQFPKGQFSHEVRENLAQIYEQDKGSHHRALQIYKQLLLSKEMDDRKDYFQFKIAHLKFKMGIMDQARFEFRDLITKFPKTKYLAKAYYLVGYSYFLEKRYPLALVALNQTVTDFPGTSTAVQAQFFVAEILEEQGKLKDSMAKFQSLLGKYHNDKILKKRIVTLKYRLKKSVR